MNSRFTFSQLFLFFALISFSSANCQNPKPPKKAEKPKPGHHIKVKLNGIANDQAMLAYHYGNKQYLRDTVQVDADGNFEFKADTALPQGIYMVVPPDQAYFEFIVTEDQHFSLETDTTDFISSMQVKGSDDNTQFNLFQKTMTEAGRKAEKLRKTSNDATASQKEKDNAKSELEELDIEIKAFRKEFLVENEGSFFVKILKAMQDPEPPEFPLDEEGNVIDSTFKYKWAKAHYFDNVDFTDDRLIRTPIYHKKIMTYLDKYIMQIPDSLIGETDMIIEATLANEDMFKYTLVTIFNKYVNSKIMGFDKIYAHIGERWYLTGKAWWADSTQLANIEERVSKLSHNFIGNVATDLDMMNYSGGTNKLHDMKNKYTVVYFWDPNCGHCKKVTPQMYELYKRLESEGIDIGVYAVSTIRDMKQSQEYILENKLDWVNVIDPYRTTRFKTFYDIYSTPVIYLLDEDKKILAKRLDADQVERIIKRKEGIEMPPEPEKEDSTDSDHDDGEDHEGHDH